MLRFLSICLGGAIGTGVRYLVTVAANRAFGQSFPVGTLIVNLVGSFLLGLIGQLAVRQVISDEARLFLGTGVMGGLTTYSTFNYETTRFLEDRAFALGAANFAATTLGCFLAGLLGMALARWWKGA